MRLEPPNLYSRRLLYWLDASRGLIWTKSVDKENIFIATTTIIKEALKELGQLSIYTDGKTIRNAHKDPQTPLWTQRFHARKLAVLTSALNCYVCDNFNDSTSPWSRVARHLRNFNTVNSDDT